MSNIEVMSKMSTATDVTSIAVPQQASSLSNNPKDQVIEFLQNQEMMKAQNVILANADNWIEKEIQNANEETLLILVCGLKNKEDAYTFVYFLLHLDIWRDAGTLVEYVNRRSPAGTQECSHSALKTAISKENDKLVQLLLTNGADMDDTYLDEANKTYNYCTSEPALKCFTTMVSRILPWLDVIFSFMLKKFSKLYYRLPCTVSPCAAVLYNHKHVLIFNKLSDCLKIEPNDRQPHYKRTWRISCNFTSIFNGGVDSVPKTPSGNIQSAKMFNFLKTDSPTKAGILLHPLIQIFLHLKKQKLTWIIGVDMVWHISWYIAVAYLMYVASDTLKDFISASQNGTISVNCSELIIKNVSSTNSSDIILADSNPCQLSRYWHIMWIPWIVHLIKECIELHFCKFWHYFSQLENLFQLLLLVFVGICLGVQVHQDWPQELIFVYMCTLLVALLLIQAQLSKIGCIAIYNEMFYMGLANVVRFAGAFAPVLASFGFFFKLVTSMGSHNKPMSIWLWLGKVWAMMIGDLNYDEYGKEMNPGFQIVLFLLVMVFFTLTVVLLLQNLLVGLTVDNIEDLQQRATANCNLKILEYVYLFEMVTTSVSGTHTYRKGDSNTTPNEEINLSHRQQSNITTKENEGDEPPPAPNATIPIIQSSRSTKKDHFLKIKEKECYELFELPKHIQKTIITYKNKCDSFEKESE